MARATYPRGGIYKGFVVFIKCEGGEVLACYQKPGTPLPPRVIQLPLEDPDIPPLPAARLEQIKRDQGLDFSAPSLDRMKRYDGPPPRGIPMRRFVEGIDKATGLKCHIEDKRVTWVDEPL